MEKHILVAYHVKNEKYSFKNFLVISNWKQFLACKKFSELKFSSEYIIFIKKKNDKAEK